jgi:solute carrier family 25 phosphate transporter 3
VIYMAGSASAEFIADIALCPFEAVKARGPGAARAASRRAPFAV